MRKNDWNKKYVQFIILQARQRAALNREEHAIIDPDREYWGNCKPGRHRVGGERKYIIREKKHD